MDVDDRSASPLATWLDAHTPLVNEPHVSHSSRGFELTIERVPGWRWAISRLVEHALAASGHPCCGRSLGRIGFVGDAAWHLLNCAARLDYGQTVHRAPLTPDEAVRIAPHLAPELAEGGAFPPDTGTSRGDG